MLVFAKGLPLLHLFGKVWVDYTTYIEWEVFVANNCDPFAITWKQGNLKLPN